MLALELLIAAATATPALSANLQPLSFLVGHCWTGEMKGGSEKDTHCFEPMYGGVHVRDRHEVRNGKGEVIYAGETIYSWNAASAKVEYIYVSNDGGVSRGTMVPKDGALDFGDEVYRGADGKEMKISTLWRPAGASAYETVSRSSANPTGQRVVVYRRAD